MEPSGISETSSAYFIYTPCKNSKTRKYNSDQDKNLKTQGPSFWLSDQAQRMAAVVWEEENLRRGPFYP